MDQGVLQAMKNRYKRKLLQKVICAQDLDQTQSIKDAVKLHTSHVSRATSPYDGVRHAISLWDFKANYYASLF